MMTMLSAVVLAVGLAPVAQEVTRGGRTAAAAAAVVATDSAARTVTLRNGAGEVNTLAIGPDVRGVENWTVGDTLRISHFESLVLMVRKSGAATVPPAETPIT